MNYGSVCSGIEAASVAWHPLGWKPAWFAEIEPFPSAVLAHHWPEVPNLGDFTAIRHSIAAGELEAPDVLVGGTPCQAFSVAGLRKSMDDSRGQLTLEFVRLANAIDSARSLRGKRPVTVVWENVPGVLNTPDNAFGCFLGALAGEDVALEPPGGKWTNAGVVVGPARTIAWRVLDAQYFGVAQRRRRVFVVASARDGFCPDEVLFEFDGVRRDSPPSREAGQGFAAVAGTLAASGGGMERPAGNANELDFCVPVNGSHWDGCPHPSLNQSNNIGGVGMSNQELFSQRGAYLVPEIASTLRSGSTNPASHGKLNGTDRMDLIAYAPETSPALRARDCKGTPQDVKEPAFIGFNARQDPDHWEGRTGPLDTDGSTQAVCVTGDVFHTLRAEGFDASEDGTGRGAGAVAVAFTSKDYGSDAVEGIAPTMRSMGHNESHANGGGQLAVAFGVSESPDLGHCLRSGASKADKHESTTYVQTGMQVRRLTPTEAERLQGFPDGHTKIPWRGKPADECPDGPRYKALGNSMAVPVMRWIGERVALHAPARSA